MSNLLVTIGIALCIGVLGLAGYVAGWAMSLREPQRCRRAPDDGLYSEAVDGEESA